MYLVAAAPLHSRGGGGVYLSGPSKDTSGIDIVDYPFLVQSSRSMVHGVSSAVEGGGGEEEEEVVLPTEPLIRPTIFSKGAFGGGHVMLVFGKQGGSQFLKTLSALKSRHRARPWTPLGGNSSCSLLMIWKGPKRGYVYLLGGWRG